ncbi:unnamed protein product [Medioppia subpectinata]|uniref:Uncharacterized protein n=1 Tax=Medioppia subpectinata TaxID=1979941 RepID=A0A7R9KC49_9ACAR|nr:unnamed protein product [Medioppia subpectinata]CAG2100754.1 unnamed protein product [Medioppia subpectinata]
MRFSILNCWKWIVLWISPPLLSSLFLYSTEKEVKCVFVVLLMIIYWLTEAVPLAITALLPMFLYPLLEIMSTKQVASTYINDTLMVFLGSIISTVAIEQSNLHQRIALRILMLFGTSPIWLLLGFMCTTSFISMWISDTATTALMVPIIEAVILNIMEQKKSTLSTITHNNNNNNDLTLNGNLDPKEVEAIENRRKNSFKMERDSNKDEKAFKLMRRVLFLSVTFSSLIGGTGTLTGTTTNLIFKGMVTNLEGDNITFANWMLFAIPGLIICVLLVWVFMTLVFVRKFPKSDNEKVGSFIRSKYNSLGPVSFHEIAVLIMFSFLLTLWFFRDPDFFKGWAPALHPKESNYINDASAAMFIVCMMFVIPANPRDLQNSKPLMTWKAVNEKVPWGVFLLMGGAFSMSSGIKESGLSKVIGRHLNEHLSGLSPLVLQIVVCTLSMFFTEVSSNAATSTIFLPIVKHLAESLHISPLRFMLPVTVVSSFAFMFPAGSPSNAIVYEAANLKVPEMAIPGIFCKFICLSVVIGMSNSWAYVVYNMHDLEPNAFNTTLQTTVL